MEPPLFEELLASLTWKLEEYDPYTLLCIDTGGNWSTRLENIKDRISNELIHRLWEESGGKVNTGTLEALFQPFIASGDNWTATCTIAGGSEGVPGSPPHLMLLLNALTRLIEYDCYERNSLAYVPAWDRKGIGFRERCRARSTVLSKQMRDLLEERSGKAALLEILKSLREKSGVYSALVLTIAEEEKVRKAIGGITAASGEQAGASASYELLYDTMDNPITAITSEPKALLRPCIELLTNPAIEVSSGLPYEAVSLLCTLEDPRCTDTLFEILDSSKPEHTDLRANLIYAIGNQRVGRSLDPIVSVLQAPDTITVHPKSGDRPYQKSLSPEKREAIWALGKTGIGAVGAIPALSGFAESGWREIRIALAWAMGRIGKEQREKHGGIDASIIITLMRLLLDEESTVFEEAVSSLEGLGLPEYLHSLYLHNIETIPILSLKPSRVGLYELSETLIYLLSLKKIVVMAITGDSGTGKTYFCQCLLDGFSDLKSEEIVYLQRDRPSHMKILNRILGIELLRKHVDPVYYEDYPTNDEEDDPGGFFREFIASQKGKRLIILDGWRDEAYFHQLINRFYEEGYLDLVISFQTTYSTKRLNLEERERQLERVRNCLACTEKPVYGSRFFKEGKVLTYALDNSIPSRLEGDEIREVFQRKKVETWGDYIRIGDFEESPLPLETRKGKLRPRTETTTVEEVALKPGPTTRFDPAEVTFNRILNEDLEGEANLLQTIHLPELGVGRIAFYQPGQLAFGALEGEIGILTGLNDHALYTGAFTGEITCIAVNGEEIWAADNSGSLKLVTFHDSTITTLAEDLPPATSIAADGTGPVATCHTDGSVRIWDTRRRTISILRGHSGAVNAVSIDRQRRIYSAGRDRRLVMWNLEKVEATSTSEIPGEIRALDIYPDGRIVTVMDSPPNSSPGTEHIPVWIVDIERGVFRTLPVQLTGRGAAINAYFDGRIIIGIESINGVDTRGTLAVVDPRTGFNRQAILSGHPIGTRDCITMGPRMITCGSDSERGHTLRIWGTGRYVRVESRKLMLLGEQQRKPPFYRTLF